MNATFRFDPFREFENLHRQMHRLFGDPDPDAWRRPFTRFSFLPGRSARTYPLVNVSEDEENVYIEALAPGVDADSLNITAVRNELTISGTKPGHDEVEADAFHRNERAAGRFVRTLTLPSEVDQDKAEAEYTNGILRLTLPKAESARPRRIEVSVK